MSWLKKIHKTFGGGLIATIGMLALCVLVFLASDSIYFRFPQWRMVFEPLKDLALAATAALIVAVIDHFVTIRKVALEVTKGVEDRMVDVMNMFINGSKDTGLVRVHKRLDFSELFESLGPNDELLWLDTYCPGNAEFIHKIRPAFERGAKTRMLIIDPRSANAHLRADEIRETETFSQDVEVFIRRVSSVRCGLKKAGLKEESCQILAYDDLPCMPMYIVMHKGVPVRGYSGFFLAKPSAFFAHVEWTVVPGGVLENMCEYFEQKWQRNLQRTTEFFHDFTTQPRNQEVNGGSRPKRVRSLQPA
jgi:hypothetical protein